MAEKNALVSTGVQTEQNGSKYSFDEANIANIRKLRAEKRANGPVSRKVFTMVQKNTSCEIEITKESRRACAEALLR
jgi:hypothetical protein